MKKKLKQKKQRAMVICKMWKSGGIVDDESGSHENDELVQISRTCKHCNDLHK